MRRGIVLSLVLGLTLSPLWALGQETTNFPVAEREVKELFDRFVAAQNAHDLTTVGDLLLDSPRFLWITRGTPLWGREAALKRFETLYEGTYRWEPSLEELQIIVLKDDVAHVYVPITYTIGVANHELQLRFLMNHVIVKTVTGWKVASILPTPAPAALPSRPRGGTRWTWS